jgi:hypothetical protein
LLTKSKIHYKRNILISIILSEILIISAFVFSPGGSLPDRKIIYDEPLILFDEIPRTIQSLPAQVQRPEIPSIYIPEEVEAFELLQDVNLKSEVSDQNVKTPSEFADQSNIRPVMSAPRLIFEVVPAYEDNEFKGSLQLSLKINEKGRVIGHRIISNSLDCSDCLNDIIKAAYRSKWEPAIVNGKFADYWVVKSYVFN